MSNDRCNKSIHCTVEQCANHCPTASYCALGQHYRWHARG